MHFATHGILGLDIGQQPALVLSLVGNDGQRDADGGVNDGFLRLDEVTRLRLNADLVVLSACRTGQGRLYSGEGVTGLARAFLYAGCRGVLSSLWSVDDRETANLMATLYAQLQQGRSSADEKVHVIDSSRINREIDKHEQDQARPHSSRRDRGGGIRGAHDAGGDPGLPAYLRGRPACDDRDEAQGPRD